MNLDQNVKPLKKDYSKWARCIKDIHFPLKKQNKKQDKNLYQKFRSNARKCVKDIYFVTAPECETPKPKIQQTKPKQNLKTTGSQHKTYKTGTKTGLKTTGSQHERQKIQNRGLNTTRSNKDEPIKKPKDIITKISECIKEIYFPNETLKKENSDRKLEKENRPIKSGKKDDSSSSGARDNFGTDILKKLSPFKIGERSSPLECKAEQIKERQNRRKVERDYESPLRNLSPNKFEGRQNRRKPLINHDSKLKNLSPNKIEGRQNRRKPLRDQERKLRNLSPNMIDGRQNRRKPLRHQESKLRNVSPNRIEGRQNKRKPLRDNESKLRNLSPNKIGDRSSPCRLTPEQKRERQIRREQKREPANKMKNISPHRVGDRGSPPRLDLGHEKEISSRNKLLTNKASSPIFTDKDGALVKPISPDSYKKKEIIALDKPKKIIDPYTLGSSENKLLTNKASSPIFTDKNGALVEPIPSDRYKQKERLDLDKPKKIIEPYTLDSSKNNSKTTTSSKDPRFPKSGHKPKYTKIKKYPAAQDLKKTGKKAPSARPKPKIPRLVMPGKYPKPKIDTKVDSSQTSYAEKHTVGTKTDESKFIKTYLSQNPDRNCHRLLGSINSNLCVMKSFFTNYDETCVCKNKDACHFFKLWRMTQVHRVASSGRTSDLYSEEDEGYTFKIVNDNIKEEEQEASVGPNKNRVEDKHTTAVYDIKTVGTQVSHADVCSSCWDNSDRSVLRNFSCIYSRLGELQRAKKIKKLLQRKSKTKTKTTKFEGCASTHLPSFFSLM